MAESGRYLGGSGEEGEYGCVEAVGGVCGGGLGWGEEGSRAGQAEEGRGARLRRGCGWLGHGVRGSRAHAVRG
jgi:hypothetical protein